jgi:hypothetical protein
MEYLSSVLRSILRQTGQIAPGSNNGRSPKRYRQNEHTPQPGLEEIFDDTPPAGGAVPSDVAMVLSWLFWVHCTTLIRI